MNDVDQTIRRGARVRGLVRPWPLRVIIVLLIVEGVALLGLSLGSSGWFSGAQLISNQGVFPRATDLLYLSGVFGPIGLAALMAALGLLIRLRFAWLLAMLVQASILLTCLQLYAQQRPQYIYPLMLCSIITVLYLNSLEVRVAFQAAPFSRAERSLEALDES